MERSVMEEKSESRGARRYIGSGGVKNVKDMDFGKIAGVV